MVARVGSELGRNLRRKKVTTTDHQETQPDQQESVEHKAFVVQYGSVVQQPWSLVTSLALPFKSLKQ